MNALEQARARQRELRAQMRAPADPAITADIQRRAAEVAAAGGRAGFQGDVTVAPVTNPTALETNPDARPQQPATAPAKPQQ